jgi:aminopeptidase N
MGLVALLAASQSLLAQEPAAPAYMLLEVERYEGRVSLLPAEGRALVQMTLTVTNPSSQAVDRLTLRLGPIAEVAEIRLEGTPLSFTSRKDELTGLVSYAMALPEPVRAGRPVRLTLTYSVHAEEATPRAALTPEECVLLPESLWLPMIHTPFQIEHRVDLSPFTLSIESPEALLGLSSGRVVAERVEGGKRLLTFEEPMLSQPVFIARDFERVGGDQGGVEFYVPRGFTALRPQTLERLRAEIVRLREFYTAFFGAPVDRAIRVVASSEVPAYGAPGLLLFDERVFARDVLDEDVLFFMAAHLARLWMGARVAIRGVGHAVLDQGLPSYLAFLYMEHRFGASGRDRAIERFRRAYAALVSGGSAYDVPLLRQTLLARQYYTSIFNKTPMVLRLLAHALGPERFHALVREMFARPAGIVAFEDFRRGCLALDASDAVKGIFEQWFSDVVLPDFAVGKPVAEGGVWTVQVANFGNGEAVLEVEAVTAGGQRLRHSVRVEAQGYGQVRFREEPVSVTADPDRLYLQADYTNDTWPRRPSTDRLVSQGTLALVQGRVQEAETALRQALAQDPDRPLAQAALARALALLGRGDEADEYVRKALAQEPLPLAVYAWAQMARGEIALARGQPAEAAEHFRQASFAFAEDTSLLMARDALIRAESAAQKLPAVEPSVREFIRQLDGALSTGRPAAVREIVTPQNLKRFITGASFLKEWKTEILRAEALDRNRVLVDARIAAATVGGKQTSSRALYVLRRNDGRWTLDDIPVFLER